MSRRARRRQFDRLRLPGRWPSQSLASAGPALITASEGLVRSVVMSDSSRRGSASR